jgi:MFS family permease
LAPRSRKRGRRARAPGEAVATPAVVPTSVAPQANAVPQPQARPASRSELRNEAVRATLKPYGPGERPWAITVSALLAAGFGTYNLVAFLLGDKLRLDGQKPGTAGVLLFALVMFACAGGMWRMRYWAVLAFEALLVLVILAFAVLLIRVSNLAGLAVCVVGLGVGGTLFYKLVRAMSRMQVPAREKR